MSPSLMWEHFSDFASTVKSSASCARTLLLAPPSLSSHEESLQKVLASRDRAVTDLQMLDRLSAGLLTLPSSTYDEVLILADADGTRSESARLLGREVFGNIAKALKPGGKLQAQSRKFCEDTGSAEFQEAILAGLSAEGDSMVKPDYAANEAVPLRILRKKDIGATLSHAQPHAPIATMKYSFQNNNMDSSSGKPHGVGFIDLSDDFGEDDGELIDEDTLLTEEDMRRPVNSPPECAPRVGKRRRACKDCTCGLAEKIAAEDAAQTSGTNAKLKALKLDADDLTEVDFTVQGRVGSCGNCSLGDAFRCDGCPYTGMPAFKPGEEVRLLKNDVQL